MKNNLYLQIYMDFMMIFFISFILFNSFLLVKTQQSQQHRSEMSSTRSRRILPADSYQILGQPGFRRFGQCNLTYAWLLAPPTSSLDAYGHATACTRLQLLDGQIISNSDHYDEKQSESNPADNELKRINKQLSASIINLERLDILIRAEPINLIHTRQLAEDARYFFLADRVGDLNLMGVFRPDKQMKMELINPLFVEQLIVTPQHVLCSRKQCPLQSNVNDLPTKLDTTTINSDLDETTNNTIITTVAALNKAERNNRDLYLQLVISRVVCALISFMCIVFAITSLTLCVKLRRYPNYLKKTSPISNVNICHEPNPSPSFYQMNGKINMGQSSPLYLTDQSPRHFNLPHHIPSETASMNNVVMTASNLSTCDGQNGLNNLSIPYKTINSQYTQLPTYPGPIVSYTDNSGLITLYPVPSHTSIGSNPHGLLLQCQNGSISPAPSNHSHSDNKNSIGRTGSLGRYPRNSMCYGDIAKRKILQQFKRIQQPQPPLRQDNLTSIKANRPIPLALQQTNQSLKNIDYSQINNNNNNNTNINGHDNISNNLSITKIDSYSNRPDDLITFNSHLNYPPIIHRFSELSPNSLKSMNSDDTNPELSRQMNNNNSSSNKNNTITNNNNNITTFTSVNDGCVSVIRKPAHVN